MVCQFIPSSAYIFIFTNECLDVEDSWVRYILWWVVIPQIVSVPMRYGG